MTNTTNTEYRPILETAYGHSWYTILGTGGELDEWIEGYTEILEKAGIDAPLQWVATTGGEVNDLAEHWGEYEIAPRDGFPNDLPILLFEYDPKDAGKLAMIRLQMADRWFDDILDIMTSGVAS